MNAKTDPLQNWPSLIKVLSSKTEAECWALLEREKAGLRREMFLTRIFTRASRLRTRRELKELHEEMKKGR